MRVIKRNAPPTLLHRLTIMDIMDNFSTDLWQRGDAAKDEGIA